MSATGNTRLWTLLWIALGGNTSAKSSTPTSAQQQFSRRFNKQQPESAGADLIPIKPGKGAHCFFLHTWFVALAWWELDRFPLAAFSNSTPTNLPLGATA